jgi:hypothetical protein
MKKGLKDFRQLVWTQKVADAAAVEFSKFNLIYFQLAGQRW